MTESDPADGPGSNRLRRRLVLGGGGAVVAAGAGFALGRATDSGQSPTTSLSPIKSAPPADPTIGPIEAYGKQQAGVTRPGLRQAYLSVSIADLAAGTEPVAFLAELGELIADLCSGSGAGLAGVDPARLSITVGIGPDLVLAIRGPNSPGGIDLPKFAREEIPAAMRGGDLLIQYCADDPTVIVLAEQAIAAEFGSTITLRWQVSGFRGAVDGTGARNLLGFYDGISVPKTPEDQDQLVWISEPEELAGASIAVVRMMPIDVGGFVRRPLAEQEAAIGRRRDNGIPLSGGDIETDPNLQAKNDAGTYDIAIDAHVRRAHPLPSGAEGLMLRRSYSYARGADDQGLIFVSFQRDLTTFTKTQARMDQQDALMEYTLTIASGTFLILPGYGADQPLGSTLAKK